MIKIDKDIPLPKPKVKWPLGEMEVGNSFFAPDKNSRQMQNAASNYRRKGMKFSCEERTENEVKGTRVWRTE